MRVLVHGYYGKLNGGDDLLQASLAEMLGRHRLAFTSWPLGYAGINSADLLIIGGGSLWPGLEPFVDADQLLRSVHIPIAVLGISARSEDGRILALTRRLAQRTVYFHVRDQATGHYFGCPDRVKVGPDLFWWGPFLRAPAGAVTETPGRPGGKIAVNLREWRHQAWDPGAVVRCLRSGTGRQLLGWPLHFGWPEGRAARFNDRTLLASLGFEVPDVLSWTPILSADFGVAMRYHAVQVAVRLGKPVIGFDYHPKVAAFFFEQGLSDLCVPLGDPLALQSALQLVEADYAEWRDRFSAVAERLQSQARACREEFLSIVDEVEGKRPRQTFRSRFRDLCYRVGELL